MLFCIKTPQNSVPAAAALVPGLDLFMERIEYRCRKGKEYNNHPTMTPLQKLKAILSIDDEFEWILHLRGLQPTGSVRALALPVETRNAA